MMSDEQLNQFLASPFIGVVGASVDRNKFGNKVLRCYQQNNYRAIPVHPKENQVEGLDCVASVVDLPEGTLSISMITPPQVTEKVVEQAVAFGIKNVWMQPGSESPVAVEYCEEHDLNVIADGCCVLVALGYHNH